MSDVPDDMAFCLECIRWVGDDAPHAQQCGNLEGSL